MVALSSDRTPLRRDVLATVAGLMFGEAVWAAASIPVYTRGRLPSPYGVIFFNIALAYLWPSLVGFVAVCFALRRRGDPWPRALATALLGADLLCVTALAWRWFLLWHVGVTVETYDRIAWAGVVAAAVSSGVIARAVVAAAVPHLPRRRPSGA
jgi:hypothetical protein